MTAMRRREGLRYLAENGYEFGHICGFLVATFNLPPDSRCWTWHREFTVHGITFTVSVPYCRVDIGYWNGGEWMDWLSKFLGIAIIHKNDLERISARRSAEHIDVFDMPCVYEPLRGVHAYYCLRDVVHLLPKKTLCHWCGKPVKYPDRHVNGKRHRAWFDPLSRTWQYEYFCSEACRTTAESLERLMRLCQYERRGEIAQRERRKYQRRRRELKWVRKGRALLNQCQNLIRNPANLQEASRLRREASTQDANLRNS